MSEKTELAQVEKVKPKPERVSLESLLNKPKNLTLWWKGALLGPTGSGKTQALASLPQSKEKPGLLIDWDGRWETLREQVEAETIKVINLFDPDPKSPKAWDNGEIVKRDLWALAHKGDFPYSFVAEDGLSQMGRMAMNSALLLDSKRGLGGAPAVQHYMPQIQYLVNHINSMRNLPCHYIINGHFDLITDEGDTEGGEKLKVLPKITKSLRTEFPSWFNEVYYCWRLEAKGGRVRYYWTTAGSGKFDWFKSTMNTRQKFWRDPIELDFDHPPVGFERLLAYRKGELTWKEVEK